MKNKQLRTQFLNDNWKLQTLNFKWTNSGVCHLTNKRDEKIASAGGGGYDKKGSCLGTFNKHLFRRRAKKIGCKFWKHGHPLWNLWADTLQPKGKKSQKKALKKSE